MERRDTWGGLASFSDVATLGALCDGPLRPGELTVMLGVTTGGTTKLVDRLVAAGFVVRHHGQLQDDRRAVVIEITRRGRARFRVFAAELSRRADLLSKPIDDMASAVSLLSDADSARTLMLSLQRVYNIVAAVSDG